MKNCRGDEIWRDGEVSGRKGEGSGRGWYESKKKIILEGMWLVVNEDVRGREGSMWQGGLGDSCMAR